jgi:hypothetical protein
VSALHFPSRFALLVRSWRFQHTTQEITVALETTKDRLAKYTSGEAVKMDEQLGRRKAELLATHLEKTGVLKGRDLSRKEFIEQFWDPDDVKFAHFVVAHHKWPLPVCVQSAPRQNVESLAGRLIGKCFLYRFGVERRRSKQGPDTTVETKVPVLRRIPVSIEDPGENYLTYKDSYGWYGTNYEVASAAGFVFYTKAHICIFAEDVDARKQSDLFMIQLRDGLIDNNDKQNPLREGIILMNGDLDVPTASKVIMRRVPDSLQNMSWDDFVKKGELKVDLRDDDKDGIYVLQESGKDREMVTDQPLGTKPYSWYANRLQIRKYKLEILLDDED